MKNNSLSPMFWIAHTLSSFGSLLFLNKCLSIIFVNPVLTGVIQFIVVSVPLILNFKIFHKFSFIALPQIIFLTDLLGLMIMLVSYSSHFSEIKLLLLILVMTLIDFLQNSRKISTLTFVHDPIVKAKMTGQIFIAQGVVLISAPITLLFFKDMTLNQIVLINGFTYLISALIALTIKSNVQNDITQNGQEQHPLIPKILDLSFNNIFLISIIFGSMSVLIPLAELNNDPQSLLVRLFLLAVGNIFGGYFSAFYWKKAGFNIGTFALLTCFLFLALTSFLHSEYAGHFFAFTFGQSLPAIEILINQMVYEKLLQKNHNFDESLLSISLIQVGTVTKLVFAVGVILTTFFLYFYSIARTELLILGLSSINILIVLNKFIFKTTQTITSEFPEKSVDLDLFWIKK